jgi:hypothetical protein
MTYQFNLRRYKELVEIRNKNFNGNESEFFSKNPKLYQEYSNYQRNLEDQIIYNNREKYISLLEEHLKELERDSDDIDLDSDSAFVKFSELYDKNLDDFNLLENKILKEGITDNFSIHPNSSEFSDLITFILRYDDDNEGEINIDQYRSLLEMTLAELRDYANPV